MSAPLPHPRAALQTCSCTSASRHVCHPQPCQSAAPSRLAPTWRWHHRSTTGRKGQSKEALTRGAGPIGGRPQAPGTTGVLQPPPRQSGRARAWHEQQSVGGCPPLALTPKGASPEARQPSVKNRGLLLPAPFPFPQSLLSSTSTPRGLLCDRALETPRHLQRGHVCRISRQQERITGAVVLSP